tara:strand:+ start:717 stop:2423 length:1707 start_codon:yes stop_codon:yes gene_type:complete
MLEVIQHLSGNILFDIGLMLVIAMFVAYIAKVFKQPLIPAYIIGGLILGPIGLGIIQDTEVIKSISEIGIIFLLFIVGMEMDLKKLKAVGWTTIITGTLQVGLTFLAGFFIFSRFVHLDTMNSIYAGLIIAFSSTMVVLKLLSDEEELLTLHGRIILGILFMQDIFVIFALTILLGTDTYSVLALLPVLGKFIAMIVVAYLLNRFVIFPVFRFAAKSQELLFILSLGVCFIFVMSAHLLGFSVAIGALIAGITIANIPYNLNIVSSVSPLKDFFAIIFFVSLGLQMVMPQIGSILTPLFVLLALVILFKPFIILVLLSIMGYDKRNSFTSAVSLAQISEFSLILVITVQDISQELFSATILLAILSIALTSYIIKYELQLYNLLAKPLGVFEYLAIKKRDIKEEKVKNKQIILFGFHRMGKTFMKVLKKMKRRVLVIDYNPDAIEQLNEEKIASAYGDMANLELLRKLNLKDARVIISSAPKMLDNITLLKYLAKVKSKALVFVTANQLHEALDLYDYGADYVIVPKIMSGESVSLILQKYMDNKKGLTKVKREHLKHLLEISDEEKL